MWCGIVSLFPEMFSSLSEFGITGRAIKNGLMTLEYWNPRDFAKDKHKTVDDRPYGGGPGMVMSVAPLQAAIQAAKEKIKSTNLKTIYLSPTGKPITQAAIRTLATEPQLLFIAGRYEGIDERLIQLEIDEEWSLGDYVISGGEFAIMVLLDAMIRCLPGALGNEDSGVEDSFEAGLLDCPHFTRPEMVQGLKVPEVLLTGDHAAIARWRLKQKLGRTYQRRPELLEALTLTKEQQNLLQEYLTEVNELTSMNTTLSK